MKGVEMTKKPTLVTASGQEMTKKKATLVSTTGEQLRNVVPRAKAVHPFGSKILIECLKTDEVLGTQLHVSSGAKADGAPQAYIVELGPGVPSDSGLAIGQRIYWNGSGCPIENPACTNGRLNALLEMHNVIAVIEES